MTTYPPGVREDIQLNHKRYRTANYQVLDVSDYAPQGDTPGTSAMFGDLQLYQPLTQETFTSGLGNVWGNDPAGYLKTEGDVDCRFPGSIFLSPGRTVIDSGGSHSPHTDGVSFPDTNGLGDTDKFFYGCKDSVGLKYIKYVSGVPSTSEVVGTDAPINYIWTNGTFLFQNCQWKNRSSPFDNRNGLMFRATTPALAEGNEAYFTTALAGTQNDVTFTSVENGTEGNSIRVQYEAGGTAGSEVVTVAGLDINIKIESGVSTANQVVAAIQASAAAMYLVACWRKIGEAGTGTVTAFAYTNLANGTAPRVWRKCGINGFARDFGMTVLHNGFVYAIEEGTNWVHYGSASDMADIEGDGPLDTKAINVGSSGSIPVLQLITFGTALYATRYDGLFAIGEDHIARKILDFTNEYSSANFRSIAVWNSLLIFPIRNKLYSWNGARLVDVTPLSNADSSPGTGFSGGAFPGGGGPMPPAGGGTILIDGSPGSFTGLQHFCAFLGAGEYFYCLAHDAVTPTITYLLAWNGSGWHSINVFTTPAGLYQKGLYLDAVKSFYFMFEEGSGIDGGYVYYKAANANGELPPSGYFPTTGTHRVTLPAMTMGRKQVKKSSPSVILTTRGTTDPTKSYLETVLSGSNNDLYFEAVTPGLAGNSLRMRYVVGGTAGSEVVTVAGNDMSVQIQDGVSTANQVLTALLASGPAMALITARVAALNSGAGTVTAFAYVNFAGGTGTRSVLVEYQLDGGDWVTLGTISDQGTVELSFAGDPPTKEPPSVQYNFMSLRLTLVTDHANYTPVVEDVTIRYIMRPGTVYGWSLDIVAASYERYGDHIMDATAGQIKSDLKADRDSAAPLPFVDIDGMEYWVYLTSLNGRLVESGDKGGTEDVALEYLFRVSLIETGLQNA